jgi:hypothetical protein
LQSVSVLQIKRALENKPVEGLIYHKPREEGSAGTSGETLADAHPCSAPPSNADPDGLLGDDPPKAAPQPAAAAAPASSTSAPPAPAKKTVADDLDLLDDKPKPSAAPASSFAAPAVKSPPPVAPLVPSGPDTSGFFRDDVAFALRYQPTGHADRFLRQWLDSLGRRGPGAVPSAGALFTRLSDAKSAGLCAKCHTIDAWPDAGAVVHWTSRSDQTGHRDFTRFSHAPHLIQPHLRDCTQCHQVQGSSAEAQGARHVPSFRPIEKSLCASCHTPRAAGDSCVKCHQYHVGKTLTTESTILPTSP